MGATLTTKGQVTIPKPVRDFLGLKPGSKVEFTRNDAGEIVVRAESNRTGKSRFTKFRGHAGQGMDTDAIMALTRSDD